MTPAALALGLAVLVAPVSSRGRVRSLTPAAPAVRLPVLPVAVCLCVASTALLPGSVVVAGGLLAATLLRRRRAAHRRRARRDETDVLQEALDVLVGNLRVGAHPVAAVAVAAAEVDGPVARSLSAVAARAALGADVAGGLRAEAARASSPGHWARLSVCWELAHEHGLAVATLLQAAQRDVAERERFHRRVEAGMAGARATALILAGLPAVGLLLGHAIGADPLGFLLSDGPGGWLLVAGTVLICCGLLWSDRITAGVAA